MRIVVFSIILITMVFVAEHTNALAKPGHPSFKDRNVYRAWPHSVRHHSYYGLPKDHRIIWLAGLDYYYHDGYFYRETPSGYVIVQAPVGASIEVLPRGHKTIFYDGITYYYFNRSYYVLKNDRYIVVTPPLPVVTENKQAVEAPIRTITVNVPNPNGSYMPVTLQEYSDGFVGPHSEFYAKQPTVDQLKKMYAIETSQGEELESSEELTFNVPNANGSYTQIILIKLKKGYLGPEGEFYVQEPTMEQLEQMYAK